MKFIDVFAGAGGASMGAQRAGFEVHAGIDCKPDTLAIYAANNPDAKTVQMELSEGNVTLKELPDGSLPTGDFHLHFAPRTTKYAKRGLRTEDVSLVRWALDFALASPCTSFSVEVVPSTEARALIKEYGDKVYSTEVDAADLGASAHKVRLYIGTPSLLRKFEKRSRYQRKYRSVADAFREAEAPIRGAFFRNRNVAPNSPPESKYAASQTVEERSAALSSRLSLSWAPTVEADGDDTSPFTLEECAIVAGLGGDFCTLKNRTRARELIGSATDPVVIERLLEDYDELASSDDAEPLAKKQRIEPLPPTISAFVALPLSRAVEV